MIRFLLDERAVLKEKRMSKKVFISYCHAQGDWVLNRLVPCLKAGGVEVSIDHERFQAGGAVVQQMDEAQDAADVNLLVFSPQYLKSDYCRHEMLRAINQPLWFEKGSVIPIKRIECELPDRIKKANPLYVSLRGAEKADQWDLLMKTCEADLGVNALDWLRVRDEIRRYLERNESVNLVVYGNPKWRELIDHLRDDFLNDLGIVDLEEGKTASRRGFVSEILRTVGIITPIPSGAGVGQN